jgi:hypothetical protein
VEVSTDWLYRNVPRVDGRNLSLKQLLKDVARDHISVHSTVYSGEEVRIFAYGDYIWPALTYIHGLD